MAGNGNNPPQQRSGISIPGQPTEEAIAEVASDAGRSLVRGFAKLVDAQFGGWIATKEAKAEAAKLAIATNAQIANERAQIEARRHIELSEIEHQGLGQRR
jgi:hypothetical protein